MSDCGWVWISTPAHISISVRLCSHPQLSSLPVSRRVDLLHKFTQTIHFPIALVICWGRCDISSALWSSAALMKHFPSLTANHSMIPPPSPRLASLRIHYIIWSRVRVRAAAGGSVALAPGIAGGLNPGSRETEIDASTAPHSLLSNWLATLLHSDISLLFLRSGFLTDEEHHGWRNCEKSRVNSYRPTQTQAQTERNYRWIKRQEVESECQEEEFTEM